MPIIGLSFKEIEGKRGEEPVRGDLKANSSPVIKNVKEVDVPSLKKKALAINFDFNTRYEPNVGNVRIGGELLYLTEKNKEILDLWAKDKKLPDDASITILNYLFRKCLLKVANIAEELQLPLPLAMPKITPKENKSK
ncbi:MAG: hypothetical protein GXO64_04790 [Candidatus Micrarchaeota archaeon]|nr:hypothetical protein [Candidatus Micrarchaeota archaeon]